MVQVEKRFSLVSFHCLVLSGVALFCGLSMCCLSRFSPHLIFLSSVLFSCFSCLVSCVCFSFFLFFFFRRLGFMDVVKLSVSSCKSSVTLGMRSRTSHQAPRYVSFCECLVIVFVLSCLAFSCLFLPRLALPCLVLSCLVLACPVWSNVLLAYSCLVLSSLFQYSVLFSSPLQSS